MKTQNLSDLNIFTEFGEEFEAAESYIERGTLIFQDGKDDEAENFVEIEFTDTFYQTLETFGEMTPEQDSAIESFCKEIMREKREQAMYESDCFETEQYLTYQR